MSELAEYFSVVFGGIFFVSVIRSFWRGIFLARERR